MTLRKQERGRDSGLGKERSQLDLRSWKREQGSGSKAFKCKGDSVLRSRHWYWAGSGIGSRAGPGWTKRQAKWLLFGKAKGYMQRNTSSSLPSWVQISWFLGTSHKSRAPWNKCSETAHTPVTGPDQDRCSWQPPWCLLLVIPTPPRGKKTTWLLTSEIQS